MLRVLVTWVCLAATALTAHAQPGPEQAESDKDKRALEVYRGMLQADPGQDYAFKKLLETAHAVGGLAGLVRLYTAETAQSPRGYAAWLVLGRLQAAADNVEDAVAAYDKAATLEPQKPEPWILRAEVHRGRHAWAEAFAAYGAAAGLLRDKQAKQDVLRLAAEAAVEANDAPRASAYFEKLIATEPGNIFLRMLEASTLGKLDQPEPALAKWLEVEQKAQGQLQHLVVIWKEVAELQTRLGRLADAEATWRKGLERLPAGHFERRTYLEGLIAVYRRTDRLPALIAELEPQSANDFEILVTVARLYEELADDDKALAKYREAQKRRPSDEEARTAALRILERIGRPEEVLQAYADLVRAFPREARYSLQLAGVYFQQGKQKEGQELLLKISRAQPNDPGVHRALIDLWLRYGERSARAAVENEYKILLRLEPDQDAHVVSLGAYYWSIDDHQRAVATWKKLLKLGKNSAEGHFLLAEVYADHEQNNDALAEYRAALAEDPQNERYMRALALVLERMGQGEEALTNWQRLLDRSDPQRPTSAAIAREARDHVIQIWEKGERLDREIDALTTRFEADPPDLPAGRFLAASLIRLGRLPEARKVLERLDQVAPDDVETLTGLVQVYARQDEARKAIAVLERLARVSTRGAAEYLHRAADLALNIGDEALALRAARQVVELNPGDATAHARVGELYLRMGHRAEAAESWRVALTLDPRDFPTRFKLASLYRDLGNHTREEQVLVEIVREAPESIDVLRAGRRLIQLALATGRLVELERVMRPMFDTGRQRDIQRRLTVELYAHLTLSIQYSSDAEATRETQLVALGERALRPLLDALEDNDVSVRGAALSVLEATHPPGATPALARLAQESESLSQVQAIAALGRVGTSGAIAALDQLLKQNQTGPRDVATWALGLSSSPEATTKLIERLEQRGVSSRDRLYIAAAFGRGRHTGAVASLIELAKTAPDVREAALWSLGRIASPDGVATLADWLARGSAREATLAASSLGRIMRAQPGDTRARAALVQSLWAGPDDAIWSALAESAGDAAADHAADAVYDGLANPDRGQIQGLRATLFALSEPSASAGQGGVVARLEPLLSARIADVLTRDDAVRARLAQVLLLGDVPCLVPPGRFPADRDADRAATSRLLAQHTSAILEAARVHDGAASSDRDLWLQVLARWPSVDAGAVVALLDPQAPPTLATLALWAAHGHDPAQLEPVAKRALASDDPVVRVAGAQVAASARADELLGAALSDAWPEVRRVAALGLALLGRHSEETNQRLLELVRDPDVGVATAAVAAMASDPSQHATLERLAAAAPAHVRRAAAKALGRL